MIIALNKDPIVKMIVIKAINRRKGDIYDTGKQ